MTVTLDTNVLIYVHDGRDPRKQVVASLVFSALGARRAPIALQVIGEFQNASVKRLGTSPALAAAAAQQLLASFATFGYDKSCVELATSAFATSRFSYWDGLLLASANKVGIRVLISEDMTDGARFGEVEVINPFSNGELSRRAQAALSLGGRRA